MSANLNEQSSIGYFKGMDVLRFICATGVIFHHAPLMLNEKGVATHAETINHYSGEFFLDVFFIISGFLISMILMKEYESHTFSVKNFFMRRIIRIWPLYFLAVLVKILLIPINKSELPWELIKHNLLYALTFTINFQLLFDTVVKSYTILWSICIEEHIYLILPFLLFLFKAKFKILTFFLLVVGLISWLYFGNVTSSSGYRVSYFVSTSYFYYFGMGTLLACIKTGSLPGINFEKTVFKPLVQIVVMFVFFGYVFNGWGNHSEISTLIINGAFGLYIAWASTTEEFIFNLKPNLSRYIGNISYGMYITHIILINFTIKFFTKKHIAFSEFTWGWCLPIMATILCIGLSTLLYYYFEKPILKFKKKFTSVSNK
ncbi:MAG TPA: acyltransferase [Bacteroidia bacterium]|nr:acyltransferase [Bacteroidia bacterium]